MNKVIQSIITTYGNDISSYVNNIDKIQQKSNKKYSPTEVSVSKIVLLDSDGINTNYDVEIVLQSKDGRRFDIGKVIKGANEEEFRGKIQTLLEDLVSIETYDIYLNYVTLTFKKKKLIINLNVTVSRELDIHKIVEEQSGYLLSYSDSLLNPKYLKIPVNIKVVSIDDTSTKNSEKYEIKYVLTPIGNKQFNVKNNLKQKLVGDIKKILSKDPNVKIVKVNVGITNSRISITTTIEIKKESYESVDAENLFLEKMVPSLTITEINEQCKLIDNLQPLCSESGWNSIFQSKYPEWYKLYHKNKNLINDISVPQLLQQLEQIVNIDYIQTLGLYYLLTFAVEKGYHQLLKLLLLDPELDVSAEDDAALRAASMLDDTEAVKILLSDPRTNPSIYDNEVLENALENNNEDIIKALLVNPRAKIPKDKKKSLRKNIFF